MSYQGDAPPQYVPPRAYLVQETLPPLMMSNANDNILPQTPYRRTGSNTESHWERNLNPNQNPQGHYNDIAPNSATREFPLLPQSSPQYYQPQYTQPLLLHQQPGSRTPTIENPARIKASPKMSHTLPSIPQIDHAQLLISLAEEYFEAAHKLAPSISLAMTTENVEVYQKLIATGLGCLETTLKNVRIPPRLEANIRLRLAGVLHEETNNFKQAESILGKGITLCDRNHYFDLKYAMQFLLVESMFKNNPKAAMKTLDSYISDAHEYQHYSWVYIFRFLRASYSLQSGQLADQHVAIQNLRSVSALAIKQEDHEIHQAASLLEAMAHFKGAGPEALEQARTAIATARQYQLQDESHVTQLVTLTYMLDTVCSLRQGGNATHTLTQLKAMHQYMDKALIDDSWSFKSDILAIPVKPPKNNAYIASREARMILGIGNDGRDSLMMSFLNKTDAYAIVCLLSGIILMNNSLSDTQGMKYLKEGLKKLEVNVQKPLESSGLLSDFAAKYKWRGQLLCYYQVYMAFCAATTTDWAVVKATISRLRSTANKFEISLSRSLGMLILYLEGVYEQGTGNLESALRIYRSEIFSLSKIKGSNVSSEEQIEHEIAILASLNTFLVLQDRQHLDLKHNHALITELEPFCLKHPNRDIQTAWSILRAGVSTNPPTPIHVIKNHLSTALHGSKMAANQQLVTMVLSLTCIRFFENVVGEQAAQSAKAARVQAKKGRNKLWESVTEGLLARDYEVQGKPTEAQNASQEARRLAHEALPDRVVINTSGMVD